MAKQRKTQSSKRSTTSQNSTLSKIPRWGWFTIAVVALLLVVAGLFYLGYQGQSLANSGIDGLEIATDPGQGHQEGNLSYPRQVPVGGIHNPTWLNCGIYDEPVRVENAVHSMEHGAVWIAYNPEIAAEQVATLQNIVRQERSNKGEALIVLAPFPALESPIVVSAWRVQLPLEDAMDERLAAFLSRYQRGPFTPEPGANCTFGGIGEPVS